MRYQLCQFACVLFHRLGILCEGEYQDRYVNGVFGAMFLFVSFAQPNLSPESYCCYSLYFRAFSHLRCVSFCWTFDVSVWLHNNKFFWTIALYNPYAAYMICMIHFLRIFCFILSLAFPFYTVFAVHGLVPFLELLQWNHSYHGFVYFKNIISVHF